ncbi:PREDICTED: actin-like protein 8 [Dipodomys ordii]|uniref:Actin-like protein 8 n=1 Tax=Dipodomys ordii TaxID=10020 RepID=A0A1S3GIU7_DIPOR|nr:PREDICTED: actin-like protein 8 [Dipodomys ordii]
MAKRVLIIDHGSGVVKAGLSGLNDPTSVTPNIVHYTPCRENPGPSSERRRVGLGISSRYPRSWSYPVQRGRICNWEGVEHIWSYLLNSLVDDFPVLVTESPVKESKDSQKTAEIMFESLQVPRLLLADQLQMSLYSSGLLTGVVADCGFGLTRVQSFQLGYPLATSCLTVELGGEDLCDYLFKSLFKDKCDRQNVFQLETVLTTQNSKCYVPHHLQEALHFHQDLPACSDKDFYKLPDGQDVQLTPEQILSPEMFFNPHKFGLPGPGLPQAIKDVVNACDSSSREMLLSSVILGGGNTLYPCFVRRLLNDLGSLYPKFRGISVTGNPNRYFSVWLGASIVAHFSSFTSQWITKEEYLEGKKPRSSTCASPMPLPK